MKIFARLILVVIVLACSFNFIGCKKTAANNASANSFECLINGNPFVAYNDINDPNYPASKSGAWLKGDTLIIGGAPQAGNYFQGIQFSLLNVQQGATYTTGLAGTSAATSSDSTCQGISINVLGALADSGGIIQITKFDTVNKIVSGNFIFNFAPFSYCDDSLYVTQGIFTYSYH